jgi:hypothetical protein
MTTPKTITVNGVRFRNVNVTCNGWAVYARGRIRLIQNYDGKWLAQSPDCRPAKYHAGPEAALLNFAKVALRENMALVRKAERLLRSDLAACGVKP